MKSTIVKRSIVLAGHKTSVSLEDAFWDGLKEIGGRGVPPTRLLHGTLAGLRGCGVRTVDGLDHAGEFREQAVAHQLHGTATVLCDARIDHFGSVLLQQSERPALVLAHHPTITDRVGG